MREKTKMVNNVMVKSADERPYVCATNIEHALSEVRDYLNSDGQRNRSFLLIANFGFEKGLVFQIRNGTDLHVADSVTRLIAECEPTKYGILRRIERKYGTRNLGIAFERILLEKNFFTSPEYLQPILGDSISPEMSSFISAQRK